MAHISVRFRQAVTALIAFFFFALFPIQTLAQQSETGLPPFGTFQGSGVDLVSLENGNLHIEIPILSVPQRATTDLKYSFVYDLGSWEIDASPTTSTGAPYDWSVSPLPGQVLTGFNLLTTPVGAWNVNHDIVNETCVWTDPVTGTTHVDPYQVHTNYVVTDTHGTKHPFEVRHEVPPGDGWHCGHTGTQNTGIALDGSGITIAIGSNLYSPAVTMPNDYGPLNGNSFATQALVQSSQFDSNHNLASTTWTLTDSNGSPQSFQVTYALVPFQTSFCPLLAGTDSCTEDSGASSLPQKLTLPNGENYVFTWSTDGNQDLLRINLPAGGYLAYTYQTFTRLTDITYNGGTTRTKGTGGPTRHYHGRRQVVSRTVNDGKTSNTWTYNGGTITDPLGNDQVHTIVALSTGQTNEPRYETQVKYYQGSASTGTLLRTVNKNYAFENSPQNADEIAHGTINVRLIRETTILEDGSTQKKSETDYETFQQPFVGTSFTVTRLNPTEKRDFDWGAGAPGALLRRTDYTYLHTNNQNYLSRNIVRQVVSETVYDSTSNQCLGQSRPCSQTTNEYDNYSHPNQPMVASGAVAHDSTYSTSFIYRGNVTAVSHWRNTDNTQLTSTNQYDDAGNLLSSIDPNGNLTRFDYADSWGNSACAPSSGQAKVFRTTVTDALSHASKHTYNSCTGTIASSTDANSQTTTFTYDGMGRLTATSYPDGGSTTNVFNDTAPISVTTATAITSSMTKTQVKIGDGLARVAQTQLTSDPDGTDFVDTAYDALGRIRTVSNPHRSASSTTDGTTTYAYDALGRNTQVTKPDGSLVTTSYSGNQTTVTDEAGNQRKSQTDALGRITTIWEAPNQTGYNFITIYRYDALDNLTCTVQKGTDTTSFTSCAAAPSTWRPRSFVYDSLSRLTGATNPETGATSTTYAYDANGNLSSKAALSANQPSSGTAQVTVSYTYDALNRLTGKSYSDAYSSNPLTPAVKYGYDGIAPVGCTPPTLQSQPQDGISASPANQIGKRSSMCDGSGATSWAYDAMGRPKLETRTVGSVQKTTGYLYHFDGGIGYMHYTSGDFVYFWVTNAGRSNGIGDAANNYVFPNVSYTPHGAVAFEGRGSGGTGTFIPHLYNSRLQPVLEYGIVVGSGQILFKRCYDFHLNGGINISYGVVTCSFPGASTGDNGNIFQIANKIDDNRTQNFTYDPLNRIASAYTNGSNWGETYTVDAWGNLANRGSVTGKTTYEPLNCAASTRNRGSCVTYDAPGNTIQNGSARYVYDAENRLISAGGMSYIYDGDGSRVEKCTAGLTAGTCSANPTGTLYWHDTAGKVIDESDLAGNISEEYYHFLGQVAARVDRPSGTVHYYIPDHLGSARIIATPNSSTTVTVAESDYYPYGGEIPISGSDPNHYKFTGKERDSESGLDNFKARYFGSSMGRFMSPDPAHIMKQKLVDPQQWNMYAYVRNNPLRFVDPTGKYLELTGDDAARKKQLEALQKAAGKAGSYLYDNAGKDGKHYVGIYTNGQDGKGPAFGSINAVSNKLSGIINDTKAGADIQFVSPGTKIMGTSIGSADKGMSPAGTMAIPGIAHIYVTSGDLGHVPGNLMENGKSSEATLGEVLVHELGHVDSVWYHGGQDTNGDAVRIEDQVRQTEGVPMRTGHTDPYDVNLSPLMPY